MENFIERLSNFIKTTWLEGIFGISFQELFLAFIICIIAIIGRRLFSKVVIKRLSRLAAKTTNTLDDKIVDALDEPISLLPPAIGLYVGGQFVTFSDKLSIIWDNIIISLLISFLFWSAYNIIFPILNAIDLSKKEFPSALTKWGEKVLKGLIAFLGVAAVLDLWGIPVGTFLAGAGLMGIAIAMGAQDLFKNVIAGIMILTEQRFSIDDVIQVDKSIEGTVEQIGIRSTRIRNFDMSVTHVPNTLLSDQSLINMSKRFARRIDWVIGLEYQTNIKTLETIRDKITAFIKENNQFLTNETIPTFVRLDKFSDSSVDLLIYCFVDTAKWGEYLAAKETLFIAVKKIVEAEGAAFAFPSSTIYFDETIMQAMDNKQKSSS